jgi:UDP-N-acetylmuramoyl-L-alanyl-D-glutamate--2,6-diaminopimelate ligase
VSPVSPVSPVRGQGGASASHMSTDVLLRALARAALVRSVRGELPVTVAGITDDSRTVVSGGLFVAVRGSARDGHDFLGAVDKAGASVAIVEDSAATDLPSIVVHDARRAAAVAAAAFYGEPAQSLTLVAVTGTNGKTTTVGMLRHLLDAPESRAASIGTLGVLVGSAGADLPGGGGLTTPGPIELQRLLRALVGAGVTRVAMEVSSHSLHQHRVEGLEFAAGVFTNLTRDHLDYHGTMEQYFAAKALLLQSIAADGCAVVNADDEAWRALHATPRALRFGCTSAPADVRAEDVRFEPRGSRWRLVTPSGASAVHLPLIGDFNISNALGAAAAAYALGMTHEQISARLGTLPQVPGRLEILSEHPTVLRDYAHTPDALQRALDALRPFTPGRLIVVFGAGGDRDRGKRPEMGAIAVKSADIAIATSDNPRTEDPEQILNDIAVGMSGGRYERIVDRREAIVRAIALADPATDVVLLAGKGHETYQIRGTTKYPFDEHEIVRDILANPIGGAS